MDRVLIREKTEEYPFKTVEKQKIGVVGMSGGAGASFVATALAKALSLDKRKRITYLEIPGDDWRRKPLIYDALGMDKRFAGRAFIRFHQEIRQGGVRGKTNLDERINWGVAAPEDLSNQTKLTPLENVRLINNISGDVIVCDLGWRENKEECLAEMDALVFVIDPMPSALLAGFSSLQEVKRREHKGMKVVWVLNKMNPGVNKRQLWAFLKIKDTVVMPHIGPEPLYAAEYNCKIPYELKEVKAQLQDPIETILRRVTEA